MSAETTRRWKLEHKEHVKAYNKLWREEHKCAVAKYMERYRDAHRELVNERERFYKRRRKGVKNATGESRTGTCPICRKDGKLVCDHDHVTGDVRGWICSRCNRVLGLMNDDIQLLLASIAYMER